MNPAEKRKLGFIGGWLSIIVNVVLFGVKYAAGVSSASTAIKNDAWHTLSDSVTSAVVVFSFWIASHKADRKHPFGHGRAESIGAVIIGTLLGVVAFECLKESFHELILGTSPRYTVWALWVVGISIIIKEAMARFALWAGNKTNSVALTADGWHHRSDAITSVIVLAGAFAGKKFPWLDGLMGVIVAGFIFYAAYEIIKDVSGSLLGTAPAKAIEDNINAVIKAQSGDEASLHHLHIHCYGDHVEATFHIRFSGEMSLAETHERVTKIENAIKDELNIESTIHIEPK
ncbi:cation diffusion facilitator family transporter [bacterium]|nr:cation transporter [bacterium]MBU3955660.1 cation diffusion facilitator family transporter [bacterium]